MVKTEVRGIEQKTKDPEFMHEISTQLVPFADFNIIRCVEGFDSISAEYPTYLTDESKLSPGPFDSSVR